MMDEVALVHPQSRLQPSHRKKTQPLSILCTPFSWKWPLHAHTHTQTMCGGNRSRLCSTKRRADQWECSYTSQGETTNEKARGPGQKFFFLPPFQGNMPRAIKSASSNWMEKADAPCSGVKRGESRGECLQKRLKGSVVQAIKRENAGIRL